METAQTDARLKIGPVEMQQDVLERLVLPGLLWQPLLAVLLSLSPTGVAAIDRALRYAKDLGSFPLGFVMVAAATTSVLLLSILNEALCQPLYHWGWLHRRGWARAHRGQRLPEILPYTAIKLAMQCSAQWHDKDFYQRFAGYLKSAVGSPCKPACPGQRDYDGLAADAIHGLLLSHVGTKVPGAAWQHFSRWRGLEQRQIRLSTSVPAVLLAFLAIIIAIMWREAPPGWWDAPLRLALWPLVGSAVVAGVGIWALAGVRDYYHAQTIIAWVHGSNTLCRLFYAVWPRIAEQHRPPEHRSSA